MLQKIAKLAQRYPVPLSPFNAAPENHVVEHFDLKKLSGTNKVSGDFYVRLTGSWVAARMVVNEDDGGGTLRNRRNASVSSLVRGLM